MTENIKPILFIKLSLSLEDTGVFESLSYNLQQKFSDYLTLLVNLESQKQIFEVKVLSPYNQNKEEYKEIYNEVKSYLANSQKTK